MAENFTIAAEPFGSRDAQQALAQYVAELAERFPEGFDPGAGAPPSDDEYTPPKGVFLLLRVGGAVMGCGGLRTESPGVSEVKRMWISPELRGRGAGRALLTSLEDHARRMGFARVRLDTAAELGEAQALYAKAGYVEIPAYNDNPHAAHWFEKRLR
ncbi:GNAT family N-acetyltransferase [Saccharopolyspora rhizosphaerae]|uniref:GNAT family N-acetyltransferase n=1 Tax=Saccharopolyspora rhizosphaerae TaxID=2492662 RepID=A0A3R8NYL0_9PSEU|nr:GNAT family N-acetyltransferase [Saccharopolyspora rhizosphaerae]RRO12627.1 GNAT family N-acetyltransferase [Saccharopolyspora rhizosphaerae]